MKILNVVGARPNFMKIAPLMEEMGNCSDLSPVLVHTGQHYDEVMSHLFFVALGIPKPDINLEVGSGTHAKQTAAIMERFESVVLSEKPDLVLVVGDVNSTIACALTSVKLGVPVAHVEAGLRSFDRTMPEEVNRVLTDAISDYLFTTEASAKQNLLQEGVAEGKIHFVGNVMIDTLLKHKQKADASDILGKMELKEKGYGLVTLHRPSNVDCPDLLDGILTALYRIAEEIPLLFPCHPRTIEKVTRFSQRWKARHSSQTKHSGRLKVIDPVGYIDFLKLMSEAKVVLTDSGGIQEETTILGVPCLTLRENTERPVTVSEGTNVIVGTNPERIVEETMKVLTGCAVKGKIPEYWDGKAAARIVQVLSELPAC